MYNIIAIETASFCVTIWQHFRIMLAGFHCSAGYCLIRQVCREINDKIGRFCTLEIEKTMA